MEALLSRGFDSATAERLIDGGHTLTSLSKLTADSLRALNLDEYHVEAVLANGRPPIPSAILAQVLWDSAWCCCVCQDHKNPIILHHIVEWHESHDHSESNLVVLCLHHHGDAHSKKALSLNLTPERLRGLKESWKKEVIRTRALAIANRFRNGESAWDWINAPRLFPLARKLGIDLKRVPSFHSLRQCNVVDETGLLQDSALWSGKQPHYFVGDCGHSMQLQDYLGSLVEIVIDKLDVVNASEIWSRRDLRRILHAGQFAACRGGHYFRPIDKPKGWRSKSREMYRKADGIRWRAEFDAWWALSSTAFSEHLSGHKDVTSIGLVKSISNEGDELRIVTSVLAIGTVFGAPRERPDIAWIDEACNDCDDEPDSDDAAVDALPS